MTSFFARLCLVLFALPALVLAQGYVVSFSWESTFCRTHSKDPECRDFSPTRYDATKLSLHGVWPDPLEYCGVPRSQVILDKNSKWDQLPEVPLSDSLRARLMRDMPGMASHLERHEWIKHGTCTGATPEAYFQKAVDLADGLNATPLSVFIGQNRNTNLSDLTAQVKASYGPAALPSVFFICQSPTLRVKGKTDGTQLLKEIRFYLNTDSLANLTLTQFATPPKSLRGVCVDGQVSIPGTSTASNSP